MCWQGAVLVIDDSGSMTSNDNYNQRLTVAQELVDKLLDNSKIGVVKFASYASILTSILTEDKSEANKYLTTYFIEYLSPLANSTGAEFYLAANASELSSIYKDIVTIQYPHRLPMLL